MDKYIRDELYDEILASSNVVSGDDYRELVCAISQVASDVVVKTLGPYGATTVIDDGTGFTYPSKDGWTCLGKLQFTDPTFNIIYGMLKKISFNSVSTVGDGTTTAMVAANNFLRAIYQDFIPEVEKKESFRQASFVESMEKVYEYLENRLRNNPHVQRIDTDGDYSDIWKIANIATNGNEEFANIIQKIYQETHNPNIQIMMDPNRSTTGYEIQKGYKFPARVLTRSAYVNDTSGNIILKNKPRLCVIFDHNVTFQMHEKLLGALFNLTNRDNIEIVIMAPYFDDIISTWIGSMVEKLMMAKQIPLVMLVQVPITTAAQRATFKDLGAIINAQIFDEAKVKAFNILLHNQTHSEDEQIQDKMMTLEEYAFKNPEEVIDRCKGKIESVIFDKSEGFIQDFEKIMNEKMYNAIVKEVTEEYQARKRKAINVIGGTLDKDFMFSQMRYIKLTGNTGVIIVGGVSDIQQHTDKDTIDDAVLACKSAYEHGYVRGMNLELLSILQELYYPMTTPDDKLPLKVEYERDIYTLLYKCFYLTTLEVLRNKYPDISTQRFVDMYYHENGLEDYLHTFSNNVTILENCITDPRCYDYNLRTEKMHDIGYWEVINSTDTDIEILRSVMNVLTTVITSNQFISLTRRFDPKFTDEKTLDRRMKEDSKIMENKVSTIIDTLNERRNPLNTLLSIILNK